MLAEQSTGPTLRYTGMECLHDVLHRPPALRRAQKFFELTSLRISLSSDNSATSFFKRAFSASNSFSLSSYFFSAEYPEWVCSPFNDFFVILLDSSFSGNPPNPADKNLAFYDPAPAGPPFYPVGVTWPSAIPVCSISA